jgi:hypothetical protein
LTNGLDSLQSIDFRHLDIHQNQVGTMRLCQSDRFLPIFSQQHAIALGFQIAGNGADIGGIIFCEEN